jgi:hypothetical protein
VRLILLVLGIALLAGCNRPPKPCFEMDADVVSIGTPVTFTSCSKRTLSYEWFMDGPAGAPENAMGWSDPQIIHAFSVAGTYTITLNCYSKFSFLGEMRSTTGMLTVQ